MTKVSKSIKIFPHGINNGQFKPIMLGVDEAKDYKECNQILNTELKKYRHLLSDEDLEYLDQVLEET